MSATDPDYVKIGRQLALGFAQTLSLFIVVGIAIQLVALPFRGTDSTDRSWLHRSNMSVLTDNQTGCQYLQAETGVTPRVDAAGHQICRALR